MDYIVAVDTEQAVDAAKKIVYVYLWFDGKIFSPIFFSVVILMLFDIRIALMPEDVISVKNEQLKKRKTDFHVVDGSSCGIRNVNN